MIMIKMDFKFMIYFKKKNDITYKYYILLS